MSLGGRAGRLRTRSPTAAPLLRCPVQRGPPRSLCVRYTGDAREMGPSLTSETEGVSGPAVTPPLRFYLPLRPLCLGPGPARPSTRVAARCARAFRGAAPFNPSWRPVFLEIPPVARVKIVFPALPRGFHVESGPVAEVPSRRAFTADQMRFADCFSRQGVLEWRRVKTERAHSV